MKALELEIKIKELEQYASQIEEEKA